MSFTKEKADGSVVAHPHKLRVMLRDKIGDLLSRYTLDEVLSEIASQRPTFDIHLTAPTGMHAALAGKR